MFINKGEIRVKKHILLSFLLGVILLLSGVSAGAAEAEAKNPESRYCFRDESYCGWLICSGSGHCRRELQPGQIILQPRYL